MQYLFFDTALNGVYSLSLMKKMMPSFLPLLANDENISEEVAPFVFQLNVDDSGLFNQINEMDLKEIIFINSQSNIDEVRNHFQKMTVQNIKGKPFYFRFWSEKVLKKYFSTCDEQQLKAFFGPVESFVCSDENGLFMLHFTLESNRLVIGKSEINSESASVVITEDLNKESVSNFDLNDIPTKKRAPRKFF